MSTMMELTSRSVSKPSWLRSKCKYSFSSSSLLKVTLIVLSNCPIIAVNYVKELLLGNFPQVFFVETAEEAENRLDH
jgi:hypothetical protein